ASVGSLMGFDTASLQKQFEIPIGAEPRAVAVIGNSAFVSLMKDGAAHKGGDVVTVDLSKQRVANPSTDVFSKLNQTALDPGNSTVGVGGGGFAGGVQEPVPPSDFNGKAFALPQVTPRGIDTLTVTPDGQRLIASTHLSSSAVLPSTSGPDS